MTLCGGLPSCLVPFGVIFYGVRHGEKREAAFRGWRKVGINERFPRVECTWTLAHRHKCGGEASRDQYAVQLLREKKSSIRMVILQHPLSMYCRTSPSFRNCVSFLFLGTGKHEILLALRFKRWRPLSCQFGRDRGKSLKIESTSFEGWWLSRKPTRLLQWWSHQLSIWSAHMATCICDTGYAVSKLAQPKLSIQNLVR